MIGLLLLMLFSTTVFADTRFKAALNDKGYDMGVELQLQADTPKDFGVIGIDIENKLPMFNFGYNQKFKSFEMMLFTGLGFRMMETSKQITRNSVSGAVSGQGCSNGQGQGVQNNCNNSNGNNSNGNNGNGNGNNGASETITVKEKTIIQEIGARFVPLIGDNINPMIELTTATPDGGIEFYNVVKFGFIGTF